MRVYRSGCLVICLPAFAYCLVFTFNPLSNIKKATNIADFVPPVLNFEADSLFYLQGKDKARKV